jgi:hypothetical protein
MAFVPHIYLYDSTGVNLLYIFNAVQDTDLFQDIPHKIIVHKGTRGKGAITTDGGEDEQDVFIKGIWIEKDYEVIQEKIEEMKSTIVVNTPYILKYDKSSTEQKELRVKRLEPVNFPVDSDTLMTSYQEYTVIFKINSW